MDKARILKTLEKEFPQSFKEKSGDAIESTPDLSLQEWIRLNPLVNELAAILNQQDEFFGFTNLMITHGNKVSTFMPNRAATFLCQRASKVGSERAVDNLEKVLSTTEADLTCIIILRGVRCGEEVQLTKDVKLVPLSLLPPSRNKDSFLDPSERFNFSQWENSSAFNPTYMGLEDIERSALVRTFKVQQVLFDAGDSENSKEKLDITYLQDIYKTMDEIRLCLTSTGLGYPLEEIRWLQYSDDVLEDAAGGTGKSYRPLKIIPLDQRVSGTVTEEIARPLVEGYFKLPDNFRGRMSTGLKHLNQAMCHAVVGDKAVDLSVTLECLLLGTEIGDNTFKVSLRAALAAYSKLEQRAYCRSIIQAMYKIRSKLVHNGIDSNNGETVKVKGQDFMPAREVVEKATDLTVLVTQNLIKNGKEPDWFDLEMSGKPLLAAE